MTTDLAVAAAAATATKDLTLDSWMTITEMAIAKQLAGVLDSGAFARAALSSIRLSPDLQKAWETQHGRASLAGAIMLAAQLHLEIGPGLGHFYLTPRKRGSEFECLPIIGYRGYVELAYRHPRVEKVETILHREGDVLEVWSDSNGGRQFTHRPFDLGDTTRPILGVIALAKITGAGCVWEYLTMEQIEVRRPSWWERTPWKTNPEPMARKTALRALTPYMPMSVQLGAALRADEHRVDQIAGVEELVVEDADAESADNVS